MKKRYLSLLLGFLLFCSLGTYAQCPTVYAGPDLTRCSNSGGVYLMGLINSVPGGQWATSGTGSFLDKTDTSVVYLPSASDISLGSVTLTLTAKNDTCQGSDDMTLTLLPVPILNAGPDVDLCLESYVTLNATAFNATQVSWSTSGTGIFSPTQSFLNANYLPSAADRASGKVTLTLTAMAQGGCAPVQDVITINFLQKGEISAGPDKFVCIGQSSVVLQGFSSDSTGSWVTMGTGTFSNANSLVTEYFPSEADIASERIVVKLVSSKGGCILEDPLMISFISQVSADAGPDQTVCGSQSPFLISGTSNGLTVQWTTSGTGLFVDKTNPTTTYWPSAADIASGSIVITLVSSSGECASAQDTKVVTFLPAPVVHITESPSMWDTTVCSNEPLVLHGSVENAQGVRWSTTGTGVFSPDVSSLNVTYIPSVLDIMNGTIYLSISSTGNGLCNPANDSLSVHYLNGVIVNAGPDQIANITGNYSGTQLHGAINNVTNGYLWTTTGTGSFAPSNNIANPIYIPSVADKASGSVYVSLQNVGSSCGTITDKMTITFVSTPLFKISGSVLLGDTIKAKSFVSLFKEINGQYYLADSVYASQGNYTFNNLTSGNYVVYASPNFLLNGSFLPTYYGNTKEWNSAQVVKVESTDLSLVSIKLISFTANTDWNKGTDNIAGIVTFKQVQTRVAIASASGVQGVTVYLLDENENELAYTISDEKGMFKFSNVTDGNYLLRFEYPGIKPIIVESVADGDPSTLGIGSAELERTSVVAGIKSGNGSSSILNAYPNPASDFVHFNLNSNEGFEYTLINVTGSVVAEGATPKGDASISLQDVKPGMYMIKLVQNNMEYKAKIYKQ